MPVWYDPPLAAFSTEVNRIRQRLSQIDSAALVDMRSRIVAYETRAFSYVWLSACLEENVGKVLTALLDHMNTLALQTDRLKPGLLCMLLHPALDSVRDLRDHEKMWNGRCDLFDSSHSTDTAVFNTAVLPLNQKTLRPSHLYVIWRVFSFPGLPFPNPPDSLALTDLAEGRNAVAHGHIPPSDFGRTKVTLDVQRLTVRIEDIFTHLIDTADNYLASKRFYR